MKIFKKLVTYLAIAVNMFFVFSGEMACIKVYHFNHLLVDSLIILEAFAISFLVSQALENK